MNLKSESTRSIIALIIFAAVILGSIMFFVFMPDYFNKGDNTERSTISTDAQREGENELAENQITLVTLKSQERPEGIFLDLVYTEAFKRLGITFHYKQVPAARASFMSDSGEVDGDLCRIYSYNEIHPNVIRVEESHWLAGFVAVATDSSIKLDGWESLAETEYRVTYIRGIKGCEDNLPTVVRPENLEKVDNVPQGFKKLLAGWSDVFIASEMGLLSYLESHEYKNSGICIVGVMEEFTSHVFLHKKHKELVPKLEVVLKKMKKEGLVEEYWNTAEMRSYVKTHKEVRP